MSDILRELNKVLSERRDGNPDESYVAGLYARGLNKILEKIGEETTEVILAAKDCGDASGRSAVISETADLWFHCLVMLAHLDIDNAEVLEELQRRLGLSGLEEKASRRKQF